MADDKNGHIGFDERTSWNTAVTNLEAHTANNSIHIPTPPSTGNYYLGNDLQWHTVPTASIS